MVHQLVSQWQQSPKHLVSYLSALHRLGVYHCPLNLRGGGDLRLQITSQHTRLLYLKNFWCSWFSQHNNQLPCDALGESSQQTVPVVPLLQLIPRTIICHTLHKYCHTLNTFLYWHGVTDASENMLSNAVMWLFGCRYLKMTGQAAERDRSPHNLSVKTTLEEQIERAESILSRWQW